MLRKTVLASCVSLAAIAMSVAANAQDRVVNVYNWSDYIDDSILEDFTEETGIKVVYDVYDSNEILETKLLAGGSGYDVVVPSGEFLGRQISAGVFQKLDKDKLPNISNMWDMINHRVAVYDPGNEHSINYMWGTTGVGYNVGKAEEILGTAKVDTWDVMFTPELAAKFKDCGIHMLDSASEVVRSALIYLGLDPNTPSTDDLAKAEELLLSVRPYVRKFHSSEYINGLANGDICLALGYSGDVFQARDRAAEADQGVTVGYAIPKEGAMLWFDQMAIPADAKNVDEAHEFLNYIMRPDVIAKASNYVVYANGNKAAQAEMDEEVVGDPAVYPDEATMEKLQAPLPYDMRTQRQVTRMWTRVVTGQ